MSIKNITVIGLGNMGTPIVTLLLKAGYQVTGYDIVGKKMSGLVPLGLKPARSPKEASRGAELIILSLRTWEIIKTVVEGTNGILDAAKPGQIIADMSTVPPWEDRYGWLFEEDARRAQVERRHARADEGEPSADEPDEDALRQNDLSMLYWGLSSTAYADLDGDVAEEYDARRFLKRPTGKDPDEEEDEDEGQGEPNE